MLFPLPLVPMEYYLLHDDRPGHPMQFLLRLTFRGTLHTADWERAVQAALARHPLLQAVVRRKGSHDWEWIAAENPPSVIHWTETAPPLVPPGIDLTREPGLRIWMHRKGDRVEALFQFHHVCCDGLGGMQFVREVLDAYHPSSQRDQEPPLEPERLPLRGKFGLGPLAGLWRLPFEYVGFLGLFEFLLHRPPALGRDRAEASSTEPALRNDPESAPSPGPVIRTLSAEETSHLLETSKRRNCTLNDLLIHDLFKVVQSALLREQPVTGKRHIRIMIPTNLRSPQDDRMPAANVVSMIFLDRRPRLYGPGWLLRSIKWEMDIMKFCRTGLTMIHLVRFCRMVRGGMDWMLPPERCLATTVISNLGHPWPETWATEDLVLEEVAFAPPTRRLTAASLGVVTYAGKLTFYLHYDAERLSPAAAASLLNDYVAVLQSSAAGT